MTRAEILVENPLQSQFHCDLIGKIVPSNRPHCEDGVFPISVPSLAALQIWVGQARSCNFNEFKHSCKYPHMAIQLPHWTLWI